MVSVFSNHFFNWVLQLKDSGHEIHWFDVHDSNTYVERIAFVHQIVKWSRKIEYPGRAYLKKYSPLLEKKINYYNQRKFDEFFEKKLIEIRPDIVHSFQINSSCIPILNIMETNPHIKWIYTAWGTDMYLSHSIPHRLETIKKVLKRVDYMFSDCIRDYKIAKKLGFQGEYLGMFPGGGGYDFSELPPLESFENRKLILVKGYEDKYGKCISVLKALIEIKDHLKDFNVIIFGANSKVVSFAKTSILKDWSNIEINERISREEVLNLMGKSVIYIGNSISDGMPNTLLESIVMEAFPIQSNPGGATAEIIEDGCNGYLIHDPENSIEIRTLLKKALQNFTVIKSGIEYNTKFIKPNLARKVVREKVLEKYTFVKEN